MIHKILCLFAAISFSTSVFSQATLFSEDFENPLSGWSSTSTHTINTWIQGTCALNGPTLPGDSSIYISKGGATPGCGTDGTTQYAYDSAPAGTESITYFTTVDASCASTLILDFDYQVITSDANDFAEAVYSTDGGSSFISLGTLATSGTWTTNNIALPAALDNSSFEIGFRFTFDNTTNSGSPIAIDNISITGTDAIDPVITCPTGVVNAPTNTNCDVEIDDYTKIYIGLSDNCTDSALISISQSPIENSTVSVPVGSTTQITLTATDETGNTGQCIFDITAVDLNDPMITCNILDTNIYLDGNCEAGMLDLTSTATVSDNCSAVGNISISQSPLAGANLSGHLTVTPVTLTATDEAGNQATCVMTARTIDTISPSITCPAAQDQYADATCSDNLMNYTALAMVTDNCATTGITVSQSPSPGTPIMTGQVVTLTANDGNGSTNSCTFEINLLDTISPSINCPGNQVQETKVATCDTNILDYTGLVIWSDNCTSNINDVTFTQNPAPDAIISGVTVTTITITDSSGNTQSCSFNVTVEDLIDPIITCPADQDIYTDGSCNATIPDLTSLAVTSDNCSNTANITVTQSPAVGTITNGVNTSTVITLTATDENNNTSQCTFNVINRDTIAPTPICPSTQTVATTASCMYSLGDFTALGDGTDNCATSTDLTITQFPAPGTMFPTGTHSIGLVVADPSGNQDTCYFNLVVEDQTQPTIDVCPSSQNVFPDASCLGTIGDYTGLVTTSDNCSSATNIAISQSPVAGTIISSNTTITITVTDEAGNIQTCTFTAILSDNIAPTITTCANDTIVDSGGSCTFNIPDMTSFIEGVDNCSAFADMTVSQSPLAGTSVTGPTIITLTLTDQNGNSTNCTVTARPNDAIPATITCPSNNTINNGANCDYTLTDYTSVAMVSDNCTGFTVAQSPAPGAIISSGTNEITLTVTDAGTNETSCSFFLEIIENVDPTITCPANISTCDPNVTYAAAVGNDNCLEFIITQTDVSGLSSGDIFPIGNTLQEYTITDSSGNTATCSFTVEVLDYPSPAVIQNTENSLCDNTTIMLVADNVTSGTGLWTVETGTAILNNQFAATTGANNLQYGQNTFIWTISSAACGETSDTLTVTVFEAPLPASTQDTIYNCDATTVDLTANPPSIGTGTWTSQTGITFSDINNPVTTASNLQIGWNTIYWTISNGNCPSTSDSVKVFTGSAAQIISPVNDTTICIGDNIIDLVGTSLNSDFESIWYFAEGAGYIVNPNEPITAVSNFSVGENTIVYYASHPICGFTSDTINISAELCGDYNPIIPTVITPNLDGKNDLFVVEFLDILYPNCTVTIVNRWGSIVFESDGYPEPWDGTFKGEPCQMGAYFYEIKLNDSFNTEFNGTISIIR